jgi:flagellar hook assembly protein FlgD
MKKIFAAVMVVMMVSSAAVARRLAPEVAADAKVVKSGSTFTVSYVRAEESSVKVSIYNADNKRVFSETIHRISSFTRPYNFADLPEGKYTIEISDGNSKVTEHVEYRHEAARADKYVKWTPVTNSDSKFMLAVSNTGKDLIIVNFYNASGELLFSKAEKIDGNFAKVYNLKKIKGKVLAEVVDAKGNTKTTTL